MQATHLIAPGSMPESRITSTLTIIWAQLLGVESSQIDASRHFIDMGAHSLLLLQAARTITEKFGVKIPFRAMIEEYPTINALAGYIAEKGVFEEPSPAPPPERSSVGGNGALTASHDETPNVQYAPPKTEERAPVSGSSLERILSQQLELMGRQIEVLRQSRVTKPAPANEGDRGGPARARLISTGPPQSSSKGDARTSSPEHEPIAFHKPVQKSSSELSSRQQQHVDDLIARLTARTQGSKRIAQDYRIPLADNRATAGFRLLWKEMQYPLISERAAGSRLWDIDGNEYVDLAMGFGALMFGHSPAFITQAVEKQIKLGLQLGAESLLARKAAELICKLTGTERATFCNSGTEAVMMALRLARAVTGRSKIALFEGCYHGTFDGVLIRSDRDADGKAYAAPMCPGVPEHMIENVVLLRFNDPESIDILKTQVHELAAVILEPLPSRMPGSRPAEFLRELRKLTEQAGTALIFDEVVSGFRFDIGGAQALFDVQADIVTYGKAVGGGMPVGVVAGKALYMNAVDGGMWSYGDRSYPEADTTFCAGTYFKHPFIMAALWAALNHLNDNAPELHERLNQTTSHLAQTLNSYFEKESVPIRVLNFGSLFRFLISPKVQYKDLFYYHLLDRGVYIPETQTCYLSTAHTQEDIDLVVKAVKAAVEDMRKGDLLPSVSLRAVAQGEARNIGANEPAKAASVKPGKRDYKAPLTEGQKNIWLEARMGDAASRAYNEPIVQVIRGPFDLTAMREAINQLVDRHEALRTTFSSDGDYQHIHAELSIDVPLVDFSQFDELERATRVREWVDKEVQQVFDLENGPLMRVRIAKLAERSHLLSLTLHHLITDGWSNDILLAELGALCYAYRAKTVPQLPEPMQYSEYADRLAQLLDSPQTAEDESYWLTQLAGPAPSLQLPTDRPRPPLRTYNGAREYSNVDAPSLEDFKKAASRQGSTLFTFLLAGFSALMHRLSGQNDLVIGISSAGQSLMGGRPLVGYCVNLIPFRSRAVDAPLFKDHLASVRNGLLDAHEHQNYPLGRLIKALNIPRDPSRPTLISAVFNVDKASPKPAVSGLEIGGLAKPGHSTKFDLSLDITETPTELKLEWEYNTDLFNAETIRRWSGYFLTLLKAAATDSNREVSKLEMLSDTERHQLLNEWNKTAKEFSGRESIHQLIEEQVKRVPDRVAIVCQDEQITFHELNRRANKLAHYLTAAGVGAEVPVGLYMDRSPEMVVALMSVLKAGGAYLPLDPDHPASRLAGVIEEAGVELVLTRGHLSGRLAQLAVSEFCLDTDWQVISGQSEHDPCSETTTDQLAYVLYTSGSTGKPKGTLVTHGGLANYLKWCVDAYGIVDGAVAPVHTPVTFDLTVTSLFLPLIAGGSLDLLPDEYGIEALKSALEHGEKYSFCKLTPAHLGMLNQQIREDRAGACRMLIIGGEALTADKLEVWRTGTARTRLINEYGPTETVVGCCVYEVGEADGHSGSVPIGRPIANTQMYVLDQRLEPTAVGVNGEIFIGGDGVARGYVNQADITAERFVPNPHAANGARVYRTGDIGRYRTDGNIEYLGRTDEQVKIRGYRVEPGEIEAALLEVEGIRQAVVIAREDEEGKKRLVAYVVEEEEGRARVTRLRSELEARLPEYLIPAAFVVMESLPLTPNGKVDRKALPRPDQARPEFENALVEPRTTAEKLLAGIWAQMFGIDKVGINDNFFELGGDSIIGLQIIAKANQSGFRLAPQQIFQHQTIAELARASGTGPTRWTDQETTTGDVGLIPIHHWFFEQHLPERHHFNLSNLFAINQRLNPELLQRAVEHLIAYHDALRLRWTESDNRLVMGVTEPGPVFFSEDLSSLSDAEQRVAIEIRATALQGSLDISRGPLIRAALFDLGTQKPNRLLIVIHHLAVDIVSWPILVEDLFTAYRQLSRGESIELPRKTTSIKQWAERLNEYARSPELREELAFWQSETRRRIDHLPTDYQSGENTEGSAATLTVSLTTRETESLLHDLPAVSRTQIQETLLTALVQAFGRWTGMRSLAVDVESHGREALFEDLDLSRTVGWFTSIVPLVLDLEQNFAAEDALKSVKDQLRAIPNGGIGYGLLRYMSGDEEITEKMRALPRADVCFNYMGQVGRGLRKNSPIGAAAESTGPSRSLQGSRFYLLDINVTVEDGVLVAHWTYSKNVHHRSTVEALANWFTEELRSLIDRCLSRESESYAPSDFPLAGLDEQKLSKLAKLIDQAGKPVNVDRRSVVTTDREQARLEFPEPGRTTPLVIQPSSKAVDLVSWASDNRARVEEHLLKYGAIVFRNFNVDAAGFGQFMRAVTDNVMEYRERSSPRSEVGDKIYTSTDYPAQHTIFPHNENSYAQVFPLKLGFFCETPAEQGGETLIGDCRRVFQRIDPEIRERFIEKKWMYVRNFGDGFGLGWREVFQTDDKAVVKEYCGRNGIGFEWKGRDGLRTRQIREAVVRHPRTSEWVWFNHAAFFHISTLPSSIREGLMAFREEDLPNNTFYGDGEPIEPIVLDRIREAYEEETIPVRWQKGDLVILDNISTFHGRAPFVGARKILFSMSEPFNREDM